MTTDHASIPWTPTGSQLPPRNSRLFWFGPHGEQVTGQYVPPGRWLADSHHGQPSGEIDYVPSHWRLMERAP